MSEGDQSVDRPGVGATRRLENLTDGVFAIVMTLIVFEIAVPRGPDTLLLHELGKLVPKLLTYALTFITLGALWFGNRTQGELLRRADHSLVWLTLLMLGLVALVPFSAALLAHSPTSRTAVVFYGAHLTAIYVVHGTLWLYITHRPALMSEGVSEAYRRRSRLPSFFPAIGYATATAIGIGVPLAGLIGYLVVPVPLVVGLFYWHLGRIHDDSLAQPAP